MRERELRAAFDAEARVRACTRAADRLRSPEHWLALCPELSISDRPCDPRNPGRSSREPTGDHLDALRRDGYFVVEPLVPEGETARLAGAAQRIWDAGYPSVFACVFDEFWRLFDGLDGILEPILGAGYHAVAHGLWTYFVPVGDTGLSGLTASGPHRDSIGMDAHLLRTGDPGIVNVWIALTDATIERSCIHVVPAQLDGSYRSEDRSRPAALAPADIRPLPVLAGAVLGWTSHLLHWGGPSSEDAAGPRVSAALYFQRSDLPPYASSALPLGGAIPFEQRLTWIAASLGMPELFAGDGPGGGASR